MYTFYILHMFSLYSLLFTTTLELPFVLIKTFLIIFLTFVIVFVVIICGAKIQMYLSVVLQLLHAELRCLSLFALCTQCTCTFVSVLHFPLKNESTLNSQILPCNILVCTGKCKFCERQLVFAPRFVLRCQKMESVIIK